MAEEQFVTSINEDLETTCWGCGLRLLLPSSAPIFKCGWCGAITKQSPVKSETKYFRWRRWRDCFFLAVLAMFMTLVICGGLWAIYPVVFSISLFCGVFHCVIAVILAVSTILTFSFAAFTCAGTPPNIPWGSYPAIGKGDLENYTFCRYCSKPKSPRTHHCRTCRMCIVDMDHHCPFIGNCVGAGNHRYFVAFLASAVISTIYVAIMSVYTVLQIWPPLKHQSLGRLNGFSILLAFVAVKEIMLSLLSSAVFLPARGLLLVYLFFASASVNIGLSVLLWQQLCFIYAGKTYLSHISSEGADGDGVRDCQNLYRFFGCPYFTLRCFQSFRTAKKKHNK